MGHARYGPGGFVLASQSVMHSRLRSSLQRLWQPGRGAFWLVLVFNGLSSVLAWTLHLAEPSGSLQIVLTILALANAAMGAWMLSILWRQGATPSQGDPHHVQSPSDRQVR
jgi:hypothetical protein